MPLERDLSGRCSRSVCLCKQENLGKQCIWLIPTDAELERITGEPHIDGYPLQSGLPRVKKPIAYASFSSISLQPTGVYLAKPDGSEPDVELKSETLKPLFLGEP